MIINDYTEKSKDRYKSRYLILQCGSCTRLCLIALFLIIIFVYNQTIVKTHTHERDQIKSNICKAY